MLAPIVLFVYNRPWHTTKTLEALEQNDLANQSILYIYADGAKDNGQELQANIQKVRNIIKQSWKFKEVHIIERGKNWGLADNIVDGVTQAVQKYGQVVVMEDDIVTSRGFLTYMNDALELYKENEQVMHISGYMFPLKKKLPSTFFFNATSCWGWGTWARAWQCFEPSATKLAREIEAKGLIADFNIQNSCNYYEQLMANVNQTQKTWAVLWHASVFLKKGYTLHPYPSLVNNIGHDNSGENCQELDSFSWHKLASVVDVHPIDIKESDEVVKSVVAYHQPEPPLKQKLKNIVKKVWAKWL